MQAAFRQKHTEPRWSNSIFSLGHYLTDVTNWPRVKAASQATVAAAAILSGKYTFARLQPALPQSLLSARTSSAIVPAAKSRLARKPVYVAATGAVATYAASLKQAQAFQEVFAVGSRVGERVRSAAMGAAAFGRQTAGGLQSTLALAGNSAAGAVACAGAATRGAAATMQNRPLHVQPRPRRIAIPLPRLRRKGPEQVLALL
ncbi:hypothetical protein MMC14_010044 [Varicellaria rhodocarpa]|nr:hypothetical protein [Varicellaria rhodocarpa]